MKHFITLVVFSILFSFELQAQWTDCNNGLNGGDINCFAFKDKIIFAGSNGGVFRSSDNGESWIKANKGLFNLTVHSLQANDKFVYAGTNKGLFQSTDEGNNWFPLYNGLTDTTVNAVLISGDSVFAGVWGWGVYLSTDNGMTFNSLNSHLGDYSINWLALLNGNLITGTKYASIFVLPEGENSWLQVGTDSGITGTGYSVIKGDSIFAGTNKGVMLSADYGFTWSFLIDRINTYDVHQFFITDSVMIGRTNEGHFISTDNGKTWTHPQTSPKEGLDCIALDKRTGYLYGGSYTALFRSTDNGKNWTKSNKGLTAPVISALHAVNDSTVLAHFFDNGLYMSNNNGDLWTSVLEVDNRTNVICLADNGPYYFGGNYYGYLHISSDYGRTWSLSRINNVYFPWISHLLVNNNIIYACLDRSIHISKDNCQTWESLTDTIIGTFFSMAVNGDNIFAGTDWGLYHSSDGGENWEKEDLKYSGSDQTIYSIVNWGNNIFASTNKEVFYSNDNGSVWSKINDNFVLPEINCLGVKGSNLFVCTEKGFFLTSDFGSSWKDVNGGITDLRIRYISIYDENIFVATSRNGIFRSELSGYLSIDESNNKDKNINIYPNPVTDQITLKRNSFSEARISIINQIGQEVYSQVLQADSQLTNIPLSGEPEGIYFIRVVYSDGRVEILKFVKL